MQAEPRSATMTTNGSLVLTSLGIRTGSQVEEIGLTGIVGNFESRVEEAGGGRFEYRMRGNGLGYRRYHAPTTPGIYHLYAAGAVNFSLKTRVEFTVVHPPQGVPAFIEQRAVTVTAGNSVVLTVATAPGAVQCNPQRTYQLAVAEPGGGIIENNVRDEAPLGIYKAPITPGVYHVILKSPEDPGITDQAEINVIADNN